MFVSPSKPAPSCVTSLATIMSARLRDELGTRVFGQAFGFRGEADQDARTLVAAELAEDVGRGLELQRESFAASLELRGVALAQAGNRPPLRP